MDFIDFLHEGICMVITHSFFVFPDPPNSLTEGQAIITIASPGSVEVRVCLNLRTFI